MKKLISLLVCICMITFIFVGCTTEEPVVLINDSFEGTAAGMQGPMTVRITVEDSKITDIEFTENSETESVVRVALERIPNQIIENQSLSVDIVTGATLTSFAIINAVTNAAREAGLDVDALKENKVVVTPKDPETWDTDVLVMGGGGAGLTAAISAAEQGASVTLIEKASVLGGNTLLAGAAYNAVDLEAQNNMILSRAQKDTLDSYLALSPLDPKLKFDTFPEWEEVLTELKADINAFYSNNIGKTAGADMPGFDSSALHMWHMYTGGLRELLNGSWIAPEVHLARQLAINSLDAFQWMGEVGLEASYGADAKYGDAPGTGTVLGAMWPRTHTFMTGTLRIPQLEKVAKDKGVIIYTDTTGTELLVDASGKVVGAKAVQVDGTQITINTTNGVVLATGGYSADATMVKDYDSYWGDDLSSRTLSTNMGTNQGDGIVMALEIGAGVTGMEVAQMMPSSSPVKGTMTDGIWADAAEQIWIDGEGNRFVNEYAERDVLAKASLALEDGIFYIIYSGRGDIGNPDEQLKGTEYNARVAAMVEGGHVWYGKNIAELAEATKTSAAGVAPGFTEEQLRKTIEKYNSYVANQKDDDFHKENIAGAIDLEYIESNDDVGIAISPRKSSLHHTMGGTVIDVEGHVLNGDGKIIPGLWAAGEVTGGIHGGNRLGGNAITDIFVFGRIAGINAGAGK
ncbi:Succinate dehydrogenase [Alkaliphilus metalliredigens QYMF]|uniref:Urocanate reductase n=1 Tax=Alkaliphilus metalliredigens (strain QYMF) TaxID=293826 RepID=A6TSH6_ALKMQ|nr:FAD-dependent oxidoreductase [Alkaliphilus metalliredigens]ABR49144.1 Succinate dehydrogenase [Alkaliphilus metalliredigens QYMF]